MTALAEVEWEECFLPPTRDPELERELRAANGGMLPPGTPYYLHCPWVARAAVHYDWLKGRLAHLPLAFAEQVAVVVSQDNSCRYCFAAHRLLPVMLPRLLAAEGMHKVAVIAGANDMGRRLAARLRENPWSGVRVVGYFDESFVAYFEDADLCMRARAAGFEAACVPEAVAYHVGSASLAGNTLWRTRQCHRNHALLVLKNYPPRRLIAEAPWIVRERLHQSWRLFTACRAELGTTYAVREWVAATLAVACMAVAGQTLRAARMRPAETLRTD